MTRQNETDPAALPPEPWRRVIHRRRSRGRIGRPLALVLVALGAAAQDEFDVHGPVATGGPRAREAYEANRAEHEGNPDVLVLPGLVADRKARTVEVLAESTGLRAGETIEFLLIDSGSAHGYEAVLWSHAKPSDVHRALEFIGLEPGSPVNPAALRFWAHGDPVILTVRTEAGDAFPIEQMILDREENDTLPEEGFIFTGSMRVPPPDGRGDPIYAADVYDPRSVASIYNEPTAVLDIPRQVDQSEVFGNQVVNPEIVLDHGTLVTVVMTPAPEDARPPRRDLELSVDRPEGEAATVYRLTDAADTVLAESPGLTEALREVLGPQEDGGMTFLTLSLGDRVPVTDAARTATLVGMMEMMGRVRVHPPVDGELYYRAFTPSRQWREPAGRPAQPWEIHLSREDDALRGEMVWHETVWPEAGFTPTFERHAFPVPDPAAVRARLDTSAREREEAGQRPLPAVLLVFTPPDLTYGEVRAFVRPSLETHGTVYVFVEE